MSRRFNRAEITELPATYARPACHDGGQLFSPLLIMPLAPAHVAVSCLPDYREGGGGMAGSSHADDRQLVAGLPPWIWKKANLGERRGVWMVNSW